MNNNDSSAPKDEHTPAPVKPTKETPAENPIEQHPAAAPSEDLPPERVKEGIKPIAVILIVCLGLLLIGGLIFGVLTLLKTGGGAYHIEKYEDATYYIIDRDFRGEYDLQYRTFTDDEMYGYLPEYCDEDDEYCDYSYDCEEDDEVCVYYDNEEEDDIEDDEDDEDEEIGGEIPELSNLAQQSQRLLDATKRCAKYSDNEEKARCIAQVLDELTDTDDDSDDDDDDWDDDDWEIDWGDDDDWGDYYADPDFMGIYDYDTYKDICDHWGYNQKYKDENMRYAMFATVHASSSVKARLAHVEIQRDEITLYVWDSYDIEATKEDNNVGYLIVVPFDDREVIDINWEALYTQEEFNEIKKGQRDHPVVDKPIIYLYPEEKTEVSVKLGQPELLTVSYPKYTDGWNVIAEPNGTLVDLSTNRELYSLYYESSSVEKPELTEGFVVKGEDSTKFLEEKLAVLGLTEREAEEFIVYWLPKLEANTYNLIRFETAEEIEKNMPLDVSPAPDTIIRIIMDYKALDEEIEVKEQVLETPARNGFVVVEWGGSELQ